MFILNSDNTISINKGDTFNIACVPDIDVGKFELYIHNENKEILLTKELIMQDEVGYFIFRKEDTINMNKGVYNYTIKYIDTEVNITVIESKILIKEAI